MLAIAAVAHGHPGLPETLSIDLRHGGDTEIAVGTSFGLLLSNDRGATWSWMCEAAIHYQGRYVPTYAYLPSGTLFATTHDGLSANRDGCTFATTPLGARTVSTIASDPSGALYIAASDSNDVNLYVTRDDAMTFPVMATPAMRNDWWTTIQVAPSDPSIVYLAGYRLTPPTKQLLLFRSDDGGATFAPLPTTAFPVMPGTELTLGGISHADPDLVFARLSRDDGDVEHTVFRSSDGGMTWTQVLTNRGKLAFLVRRNGDLVAGSRLTGAWISHDNGETWLDLPNAPHISCLTETSLDEVWACTSNYGWMGVPSDGAGVMRSKDLDAWTPVLRFQDIAGPVDCAIGSEAHACRAQWCDVKQQAGITSEVIDCSLPDAGIAMAPDTPPAGCCSTTGSRPESSILLGGGVAWLIARRRRGCVT